MLTWLNTTINKSVPLITYNQSNVEQLGRCTIKIRHNDNYVKYRFFGHKGTDWVSHGCLMDLLVILTLEEEMCFWGRALNSVVVWCVEMDVLWSNCVSCSKLCLIMEMAGSTGTDVKRTFTSQDLMHSPSPSLMDMTWSTELRVFSCDMGNTLPVALRCWKIFCHSVCDCAPVGNWD